MPTSILPDALSGALVVAVDDSDHARHALAFADRLARGLGRPVHAVLVWNFVMGPAPEGGGEPNEEQWRGAAQSLLREIVASALPDADPAHVQEHVLHGNTVPTLLAVTKIADQLVMGSRGRGGFAGLLLGSNSEQVVRHGHCPVTVVPSAREPEQ